MHRIAFESPFNFGDLVEYTSRHAGAGRGRVLDIVLCDDRSIYYMIDKGDGGIDGGIYPAEMRLLADDSDVRPRG